MNWRHGDEHDARDEDPAQFMARLKKDTEDNEERIHSLWHEWAEVQAEMICLAVEVCGPGAIHELYGNCLEKWRAELDKIVSLHKSTETRMAKVTVALDRQIAEMRNLGQKTEAAVKAYEEVGSSVLFLTTI